MHFADLALRNFETKSVSDDKATFSGVASTSDIDLGQDIIEAGAFGKSLTDVVLLRDHNPSKVIGMLSEFEQDGKHLRVAGEIGFDTDTARETYTLMKRGYLTGISPGFVVKKGGSVWDESEQVRRIKKAEMVECSIVAIPANQRARVRNVKSLLQRVGARDFLFDLGFEEDEVEVLVTKGFDALLRDEAPPRRIHISEIDGLKAAPPGSSEATPAWVAEVRDLLKDVRNRHVD
jgi:Escherichia/Staphylococcus phage prohead protease